MFHRVIVFVSVTGHRFRSVIDETWWAGEITDRSPFQTEFADSHFQCFTVRYETQETERPIQLTETKKKALGGEQPAVEFACVLRNLSKCSSFQIS